MARPLHSSLEVLEARIAPANLTVFHPLLDLMPSFGKSGTQIDLGASFDGDPAAGYRTHIEFLTNFDVDASTPGLQAGKIVLELFDDKAPLTVQNFLGYVNAASARGDFDGVFFHRLATGFVLQTGGYEAISPTKHIPVGGAVHNEFDASDAERANVAGTVAMAKVGGDPNSATSEFFFNLADNRSSIDPNTGADIGLDHQNGGFTVFGKVVQGMEVVNAIASLPTVTIGNFGAPYQNGYNPDPDSNANTASPTPKPSQLVSFTSVKVAPAKNSTIPHTEYSVLGVFDTVGMPSDLVKTNANPVTHKLAGDTLRLAYNGGESGTAVVRVQAVDTADPQAAPVVQEFQVKLQPNLVAKSGSDTLPTTIVGGDTGVGTVKVTNSGGGAAKGAVDVKYYLSMTGGADASGTVVDSSDVLIGSLLGTTLNLASGRSTDLHVNLSIPAGTDLAQGSYRVIAQVTPSDGSNLVESYSDDNVTLDGRVHGFFTGESKTNFSVVNMKDTLPGLLVPGDKGMGELSFLNNSSKIAAGNVKVSFYLSYDESPTDSSDGTDTLTAADVLIGQTIESLTVAPGNGATVTTAINIPADLSLTDGYYRIFGVVGSLDSLSNIGTTVPELATSDNVGVSNYHALQHNFGTFSIPNTLLGTLSRVHATLTYSGDDGAHNFTLAMAGRGYGTVSNTSTGGLTVSVEGTNLNSRLTLSSPADVRAVVDNLYVGAQTQTPIGSMLLGNVDFTGQVVAYGGVRSMVLGNTSGDGDHFVGLGVTAASARIAPLVSLGTVQDLSLTSSQTIGLLAATKWTDVNAATETVDALGLLNFQVAGNFEADLVVLGTTPGSTAPTKSFQVGGVLKNSEVRIAGNVGRVELGAISGSHLLVGSEVAPTVLSDFNFPTRSIASVIINGGVVGQNTSFADSVISAARLGTVVVSGQIDGDSGIDKTGFVADKIGAYRHGGAAVLRNLDAPGTFDPVGANYGVTVLG